MPLLKQWLQGFSLLDRLDATPSLHFLSLYCIEQYLSPPQGSKEVPAPKEKSVSCYLSCCEGPDTPPLGDITHIYMDPRTQKVLHARGLSIDHIRSVLMDKDPAVQLVCEDMLGDFPIMDPYVNYTCKPLKAVQKKKLGIDDPNPSVDAMKFACFSIPWRVAWFPSMNARYVVPICLKYNFQAFVTTYTGDDPDNPCLYIYKIQTD